eukprot:767016-Hanusia_phi.AAC.3
MAACRIASSLSSGRRRETLLPAGSPSHPRGSPAAVGHRRRGGGQLEEGVWAIWLPEGAGLSGMGAGDRSDGGNRRCSGRATYNEDVAAARKPDEDVQGGGEEGGSACSSLEGAAA